MAPSGGRKMSWTIAREHFLILALIVINHPELCDGENLSSPAFTNVPTSPASISEIANIGDTVFTCTANDSDTGTAGLTFSIAAGNNENTFTINDPTTCSITLGHTVNFETTSSYSLTLEVSDNDASPTALTAQHVFTVQVQDVNEFAPIFRNIPASPTKVAETKRVGSPVLTCSATDDDSSTEPSGTLSYSIKAGNSGGKFTVDSASCLVSVNGGLDFETKDTYSLTLQACDLDPSPLCSTQGFDVDIVDKNEPPVFNIPVSLPSVTENQPSGTLVFECSVTDEDSPLLPRGQHAFSIKSGNDDGAFTLKSPCRVETTRPLDIEQQKKYSIEIEVTDLDPDSPLKATNVFQVKVKDENDNTPYFTDVPAMPIVVPEDTVVGIPFWNCSGQDDDVDFELSGQVTYTITAGNNQAFFMLNSTDCRLSLLKALDYETKTLNFNITIRLSDLDPVAPRSVHQMFQFCVQNVNDNEPIWVATIDKKTSIMENSPLDVYLGQCSATDADPVHDHSGLVRYRIKAGNKLNLFYLDPYTCEMWVNGPLDYEDDKSHTLKIEAYDLDPLSPLTSNAITVKISIEDENDMRPQCVANLIAMEVSEATPAKSIVMALNCSDVDVHAAGTLQYSALTDSDVMKVDKLTGEIKLLREVDWDTEAHVHDLKIEVSDKGTPPNIATTTVRLIFVDADDIAPVWDAAAPYSTNVTEGTIRGYQVVSIRATDADQANTTASTVVYGFETQPTPDWFVINKYTGHIFTKTDVDADLQSSVSLRVYAHSSDRFDARVLTNVKVRINDVNDRKPVFQEKLYSGKVRENSATGTPVLTVTALDPDSGQDGKVRYSIEDGAFQIHGTSGSITVKTTLDYESVQIFRLKVAAFDLGTPSMTSQVDVVITVMSDNEYRPIFVSSAIVSIPEDTVPGKSIFQLSATDNDTGLDGEVRFFGPEPTSLSPFIVRENGRVVLALSLDFETTCNYSLVIFVSDRSTINARTATTTLQIVLTDVNDLAPVCRSLPLAVSVFPWMGGGPVVTVNCSNDADTVNGQLGFRIASGDPDGVFVIDSTTGSITVATKPAKTSYGLLVEVSDGGNPPQTTSVPVTVLTEPEMSFASLPANVSFSESTSPGTVLFTVRTCCSWVPTQMEIVSGNEENLFNLHHLTGSLILLGQLDREVASPRVLVIKAADYRGQTASSTLNIFVLDINDNSPIFAPVFSTFRIGELLPQGSVFARVTATDKDEGSNAALTYSLQDNFGFTFSVDQSGDFKLEKALDFETRQSYTLVVIATDGGATPLVGSATVQVKLTNANEFSPLFVTGSGTVTLPEDCPLGVAVLEVSANDQDISDVIFYDIFAGNDDKTFHMRADTGQIVVLKVLDRESVENYTLTIRASDIQGNTTTISVQVDITDVDDNDPVFSSSVYTMQVPHGTSAGATVGHVTVSDADVGTNADFTLAIVSGNAGGYFALDGLDVKTAKSLSYDAVKEFTLVLKAQGVDAAAPLHWYSLATVKIEVLPDPASPKFNFTSATITLPEDSNLDLLVFDLDATQLGASEGNSGTLSYALRSGNTDNHFSLDDKTGGLYLARQLDHETQQSFTLLVDAENRNNAAVKDTFTLTVNVVDINDNSPRPASSVFSFTVKEDAVLGDFVGQVIFTDADDGAAGYATLNMTGCDAFVIDSGNGDVSVVGALDYSSVSMYNCLVFATDAGIPSRTGVASVVISVLDTNNNAPQFLGAPYAVIVNENTASRVTVGSVRATDRDTGSDGNVTYTVTSGDPSGVFSLNPIKGTLLLVGTLDVQSTSQHILEIKATDGGVVQQTAVTTFTVNVADANDHAPVFVAHPASVTVVRTVAVGHLLTTVTATDEDLGLNANVTYALTAGNTHGFFTIDSITGSITTAAAVLDADDTYSLTITARDHGVPMQTTTTTVDALVSPPRTLTVSTLPVFNFTVSEDATVGLLVGTVDPSPAASAANYTILSGNVDGSFQLVKQADGTAELRTSKPLDYETFPAFQLLVDIDTGTPPNIKKLVQVKVLDVNDNSPTFSDNSIVVFVPENSPSGHTIWTLTVDDADDSATNGNTVFSVLPADNPLLDVTTDGKLVLKASPDYETLQKLDVVIEAHDSGVPQMTSSVSVTLHVIDVLETQEVLVPSGATRYISAEIPYNSRVGQFVYQLQLSDFHALTASASATITFLALDTKGAFSVNADTGEVTVTSPSKLQVGVTYFQWVVCKVLEPGGALTSELAMLRIDTFDKYQHLVAVQVATSVADLEANRATLLASLQNQFPSPQRLGIFTVIAQGSMARRRLLAAESLALVYVVQDVSADNLGNVVMNKQFLTQQHILQVLQLSADGTPIPGLSTASMPVDLVMPYQAGNETEDNFLESTIGIVAIVVVCLVVLLIVIFVIACIVYRSKKRKEWEPHRFRDGGESSRTEIFTTPRPGFLIPYGERRGSDVSAGSMTSLLDDDSGMGDSVHSARKSLSPSGSSGSNTSTRSDGRGDEIRLSPRYFTSTRQSRLTFSSADSGSGTSVRNKKQTRYTWNKEKYIQDKWNYPSPKPPVSWLPHLPNSRRESVDWDSDTPHTPRYGRRSSSLDVEGYTPCLWDSSNSRRGSADLWSSQDLISSLSQGPAGWNSTRRGSAPGDDRPPWLPSNPYAKPGFHRSRNPLLASSESSLVSVDSPEHREKMRLKDATPGHEVTWQPKRNPRREIFSEKLHWHAVSTIPKATPRRQDALARDPVSAGWAKSFSRRRKHTAGVSPKPAAKSEKKAGELMEGGKKDGEAKEGEKKEVEKGVDAVEILGTLASRRSKYNTPTYSWF